MTVADGLDGEEVTTKIDSTQLAELVQTTTSASASHELITSRIPAVTLEGLLDAAPVTVPLRAPLPAPVRVPARAPTLVSVQPPPLPTLPTELPVATPAPVRIAPPPPRPPPVREVRPIPVASIPVAPSVVLPPPRRRLSSGAIVAISCISTLLIGLVVGALLV